MEKTIKVNKKELEVLKKALDRHKEFVQFGVDNSEKNRREKLINDLYNLESIEKKANET